MDTPRPRRPRARGAAFAAIVALALAAVAVALLASRSPSHAAAGSLVPAGETTATVERRTLVERTQVDGTLAYAVSGELYDRLAGTFTWLPSVGAVIGRGGVLFRVDDLPVVLMYGAVPAYRALKQGVSDGPDVAQLNASLIALGYDPYGAIADEDSFGEATAAAVRRWQRAEGLPETGEVELGRIVFADGATRVTAVHVTLGEDPPGAEEKPSKHRPASKEKPAAKGDPSKNKNKKEEEKGEEEKAKSPTGSEAAAPKLVLSTTSDRQVVQLQVKATEQELAHVGERAPVTLPDGTVVHGRITEVGTVASEASEGKGKEGNSKEGAGNGENATIPVVLALDRPVPRLDKAPVSVELVKSIRRHVLAAPATALVATAGGGYAIEALEGARRVELAVTPGMFANGYVQVEGAGVHPGLTITEPR